MTVEQINNGSGKVTYLHHDQQGSTRLLTGSTGTVTGKCSYGAYGAPTCEGYATRGAGLRQSARLSFLCRDRHSELVEIGISTRVG